MTAENVSGQFYSRSNLASQLPRYKRLHLKKAKNQRFEAQRELNWYLDTILNIAAIISSILFFIGIAPPLILIVFFPKFFAKIMEAVVDIKAAHYNETLTKQARYWLIARACLSFILNITNIILSTLLAIAPLIGISALVAGTILAPITLGLAIFGCGLYLIITIKAVIEAIQALNQLNQNDGVAYKKNHIAASGKLAVTLTATIGLVMIVTGLACCIAACFFPPVAAIATGLIMAACVTFVVSNLLQKNWPTIYGFFKKDFSAVERVQDEELIAVQQQGVFIRNANTQVEFSRKGASRLLKWAEDAQLLSKFFKLPHRALAYQRIPPPPEDPLQESPGSTILVTNKLL